MDKATHFLLLVQTGLSAYHARQTHLGNKISREDCRLTPERSGSNAVGNMETAVKAASHIPPEMEAGEAAVEFLDAVVYGKAKEWPKWVLNSRKLQYAERRK